MLSSISRSALIGVSVRGVSVLTSMVIIVLIGSRLGPAANGAYALVTQTGMFVGLLCLAGSDVSVVRYLAPASAQQALLDRRGVLLLFVPLFVVALALSATLAIVYLSELGKALGSGGMLAPIAGFATIAVLAGRSWARLGGSILRSQGAFFSGSAVDALIAPLLIVVGMLAFSRASLNEILGITAAASMVAGLITILLVARFTTGRGQGYAVDAKSVYRTGFPLLGASAGILFVDWYGVFVAAWWLDAADAGRFRVAAQVAGTLAIISAGLFSTYATSIAQAHHAGDTKRIEVLLRSATRLSMLLGLPILIPMVMFAQPLLDLIGPEFAEGALSLQIMALGQLIALLCGPRGLVLAMTGGERANLRYSIIGAFGLLAVAPGMALQFGIEGIAVSVTANLLFRNFCAWWLVRRMARASPQ